MTYTYSHKIRETILETEGQLAIAIGLTDHNS